MIRVHTLGTSLIRVGEHRFTPIAAKRFAFLLYLAAEPGRHHPRSILRSLFFSDVSDQQAKQGIRELVYQLRQVGAVFETDDHGVQISSADVWRDWDEPLADKPAGDAAIRLVEGGFLPGYAPNISEEYSDWYGGFRGAAVSDLAKAMLREVERARVAANWGRAERAARACLAVDPLNSKATVAVAEMLAIGGSATKAAELIATYKAETNADAQALSPSLKGVRHRITEVAHHVDARIASTRFAGRDAEMALLANAFDDVKRGAANVIVLTGEPGIGKSRLLSEFGLYAALEAGTPVATTAHPHDTGMPLTVIRNLSKSLLDQPGALGCSPTSMDWVRRLMRPEGGASSVSAEQTSAAISSAVVDLINAVAAETPLVLSIDDAQWADQASLELLQSVAVSSATNQVLIVFGARDPQRIFELGYWGTRFAVAEVTALDRTNAIALATEQLGEGDREQRALIEWMAELAGGNPFFLETIVGHYRATNERFSVPLEVNGVVDQRIRALTIEAREVLEAIVALGRHATIARLEQVTEMTGPVLIRATRELERRRLIAISDRLAPAHWLIAESIERHGSPIARRLLYRRIATMLEGQISPESDSSAVLDCAETWVIAGESARAAELIVACAQRCLEIGRAREAAALFLRAAGLVDGTRREQLATAAIQAADTAGESALTIQAAELLPMGRQRGHDDVELAVLAARSRLDVDLEGTLRSLTECIAAESASNSHRLSAATTLLMFCDQNRQMEQILAIEAILLDLLSQTADDELKRLQCALIYHATFGDLAQVPTICAQLLARAAHARLDVACDLSRKAALGLYRCGRVDECLRTLEECYSLATENGFSRIADGAALMLSNYYLDAGAIGTALKWFDVVSTIARGKYDEYIEFARLTIEAEFAMWRRDATELFRLSELAQRYLGGRQTAGAVRLYNSTRLAALHMSGDPIDPDDAVRQLTQYHNAGYEVGEASDREIALATAIVCKARGDDEAKRVLLDYLTRVRRPGVAASITLVTEASALGIDVPAILAAPRHDAVAEVSKAQQHNCLPRRS